MAIINFKQASKYLRFKTLPEDAKTWAWWRRAKWHAANPRVRQMQAAQAVSGSAVARDEPCPTKDSSNSTSNVDADAAMPADPVAPADGAPSTSGNDWSNAEIVALVNSLREFQFGVADR